MHTPIFDDVSVKIAAILVICFLFPYKLRGTWYLGWYKSAPGLKRCLQVSSLKKPLRRNITEEGKDEGLMALDKKVLA